MADEPGNLTLQLLRRMDGKLDRIEQRLDDVVARMGSLGQQTAALRTDIVQLQVRIDHFDQRPQRIERRLDLIEV